MQTHQPSSYSAVAELYLQVGKVRMTGSHLRPNRITLRSANSIPDDEGDTWIVVVIDGQEKPTQVTITGQQVDRDGHLCVAFF